jgi:two-component system chemotaxis response regulator CheB
MSLGQEPRPPIRVLIAEDSAATRTALSHMLDASPQIRVCGTARNWQEVVEKTRLLQPDVITLDVEMPAGNGVEALKRILRQCPCPIIVVGSATRTGAEVTLEALSAGAFDYLCRENFHPSHDAIGLGHDLIEKIEAASSSRLSRERASLRLHSLYPHVFPSAVPFSLHERPQHIPRIVVLGTSTGGPQALQQLLPELPADLPVAMIVVQHMPPGFTGPLAERLNGLSKLKVCEAQHGAPVLPGTVYIAPAGHHTTVTRNSHQVCIHLSDSPFHTAHKPSVDVTMQSVAEVFASHTLGIILTGMGTDGLEGMTAIRDAGGMTIGQDEASSAVYGMPRCCAKRGILQQIAPLSQIPRHILQALHYHFHI